MGVNAKRRRFAQEYVIDNNGTQAAIRAGYSADSAGAIAGELLQFPEVKEAIAEEREAAALVAGLNPAWVLQKWMELVNANPNDLMQIRRVNCRHCWGANHEYQWSEREYRLAVDACLDAKEPKVPPSCDGGFGWNKIASPNPECTECAGEGHMDTFVADTRKLPKVSKRLYSGVKVTKDGIEVKTRDADSALKNLAGYLGMTLDRKEISGPGGGPVAIEAVSSVKDLTVEQLDQIILTHSSTQSSLP